ncbi:MAG: HAD family hydrolase [Ktedonobacteraceae bacterium]|nr:HAD family hydrolase [Ktedonobacteraceae bacterium]MBO0791941.1 HAD family hydrolase [Ktedonobacteraceae bacterium]
MPHSAIFFDLDDTLFDHIHSTRVALASLVSEHECFRGVTLDEIEELHAELLEKFHAQYLQGRLSIDEARLLRFDSLFQRYGSQLAQEALELVTQNYRRAYQSVRKPVAGSIALLTALKPHTQIVIVSNNALQEQQGKLAACGLAPFVDMLVVSEEVGCTKPDPAIFEFALRQVSCRAQEVVMIGDSWSADIVGARGVGMQAIWLNRRSVPCPDPTMATEIRAFEPLEPLLTLLNIPGH